MIYVLQAGTNLVAMEAMMSGIPVILTDYSGHSDLIHLDTQVQSDDTDIKDLKSFCEIIPQNELIPASCNMTVSEIKDFLIGSRSGFYYSGIRIEQNDNDILVKDLDGNTIPDTTVLSLGTNDYIPAVYENYFPLNGSIQSLTAAETLMSYLETKNSHVDYPNCEHYFRYQ